MTSKDEFIEAAKLLNYQQRVTCPLGSPPELYYKHHIFPVKLLSLLLTTLQAKPDHDERSIKFIVNQLKKLLLAQAGAPGTYTPSHSDMTASVMKPSVLSAGVVYLDPQGQILGLSNENDNFEISIKSLLWPLAILHLMNVPLTSNLSIIGKDATPFELNVGDREDIISLLPLQTLQLLLHANRDAKVMVREGAYNRNSMFPFAFGETFTESHPQDIFKPVLIEC